MMRSNIEIQRYLPLILFLASLVLAQVVIRLLGSADAVLSLVPLGCPLRMLSDIPCPTCGLGHALVDAWTGQWASSFVHHPLGIGLMWASGCLVLLNAIRPAYTISLFRQVRGFFAAHPVWLIGAVVAYLILGSARHIFL